MGKRVPRLFSRLDNAQRHQFHLHRYEVSLLGHNHVDVLVCPCRFVEVVYIADAVDDPLLIHAFDFVLKGQGALRLLAPHASTGSMTA